MGEGETRYQGRPVGPAAGDQASHQMPAARAMRNLRGTGPSAAQHASHTGRWLRHVRAQDILASLSSPREEQPLLTAMPGRLLRRMGRAACPLLVTRRLRVVVAPQQFFVRRLEHANVLRNPEECHVDVAAAAPFFSLGSGAS